MYPKSILHVMILGSEQKPITLVCPCCATFSLLVDCLSYEKKTPKTGVHAVSRLQGWASAPLAPPVSSQGPSKMTTLNRAESSTVVKNYYKPTANLCAESLFSQHRLMRKPLP